MITNLDPKPYSTAANVAERRATVAVPEEGIDWFDPRPEFDVGSNPILFGVASDIAGSADLDRSIPAHAEFWLSTPEDWEGTLEQIDHARTVLEAIARGK